MKWHCCVDQSVPSGRTTHSSGDLFFYQFYLSQTHSSGDLFFYQFYLSQTHSSGSHAGTLQEPIHSSDNREENITMSGLFYGTCIPYHSLSKYGGPGYVHTQALYL